MKKVWFDEAWADYLYWQSQDKKMLKRINDLLRDIERNNFDGIGKPEPLKGELSGFWSRRIQRTDLFIALKMVCLKSCHVKGIMMTDVTLTS